MTNFFETFAFEYPYLLLLIIPFIVCAKFCKAKEQALFIPHLNIYSKSIGKKSLLISLLKWLAIIFSIIAISSPIQNNNFIKNKNEGIDTILILDASGSMKERGFDRLDITKNKFIAVQEIVSNFIQKRITDNLGLVIFADIAFIASPLTQDRDMLSDILTRMYVGVAGEKTAIFDGVAQGLRLLKDSKAKSKIIILLTDGINNSGVINKNLIIDELSKEQIKVYTIGIGRSGEFDKNLLIEIANLTNGKFFEANSRDSLDKIYKEIDSLEKSEIESIKFSYKTYLFEYPLFLAIISLLLYIYFRNR